MFGNSITKHIKHYIIFEYTGSYTLESAYVTCGFVHLYSPFSGLKQQQQQHTKV